MLLHDDAPGLRKLNPARHKVTRLEPGYPRAQSALRWGPRGLDESHAHTSMLKLLIAVDGSPHSHRAIGAVARLAREATRLEVTLLNVSCSSCTHAGQIAHNADQDEWATRSHQSRVLDQALDLALRDGLQISHLSASTGRVAEEIVRAAEAAGIDQIVMGAHGMKSSSHGHYLLGSVAQRVLQMASVPVMLVR
jgi:nucleotide-binding universal stress UspA family protein